MPSSFLSECKQKVLNRIESLLTQQDKVTSSMRYSALADSKCIRAGLVFASGKLEGKLDEVGLTDNATSLELMHTYSLIHDDLPAMDDDEMDELHKKVIIGITNGGAGITIESAIDLTLLGRYYERFADHAVAVARRVYFLVKGEFPQ